MIVITAPEKPLIGKRYVARTVFLAGSIEMGTAENWQEKAINHFSKWQDSIVLNPRRNDWDSSWKQEIDDPQFYQQVDWELEHLKKADYILMYFDPATKSPISLLELGLMADSRKLIVVCPKGFWRKGNVDIVCYKYQIPVFEDLQKALDHITSKHIYESIINDRWV